MKYLNHQRMKTGLKISEGSWGLESYSSKLTLELLCQASTNCLSSFSNSILKFNIKALQCDVVCYQTPTNATHPPRYGKQFDLI